MSDGLTLDPEPWVDGEDGSRERSSYFKLFFAPRPGYSPNREDYPA